MRAERFWQGSLGVVVTRESSIEPTTAVLGSLIAPISRSLGKAWPRLYSRVGVCEQCTQIQLSPLKLMITSADNSRDACGFWAAITKA